MSGATSKTSYSLVSLDGGDLLGFSRLTNSDVEQVGDDGTYTPIAMDIKGLHNTGDLDQQPIELTVPYGEVSMIDAMADGLASPEVVLYLTEYLSAAGPSITGVPATDEEVLPHAIGDYRLSRATKNPNGQFGLVRLTFEHYKKRIEMSLGISCNPQCAWTLADKSCQAAVPSITATVSSISGKTVTVSGPSASLSGNPAGDTDYFVRGYIEVQGHRIGIRRWTDGSSDFDLVKQPPASWVGQACTLMGGCSKLVGDCNGKYGNLEHFGGIGTAIPAYQPDRELS